MPRSKTWAIASAVLALSSTYSLLNVIAGVDLGYDAYPGGREIVRRWWYSTVVCLPLAIGSAFAAWHTRQRTDPPAP